MMTVQRMSNETSSISNLYSLGVSRSQVNQLVQAQGAINRRINSYNAQTHGMQQFDVLSKMLQEDRGFTDLMHYLSPQQPLSQDVTNAMSRFFVARSKKYTSSQFDAIASSLKLIDQMGDINIQQRIPERLRKAFTQYGFTGDLEKTSRPEGFFSQNVSRPALEAFRRLVTNGNQAAIQLGLSTNLLHMDKGRINFGTANVGQWGVLAALALQRYSDVKSGYPHMYANVLDPSEQQR